MGEVSESSREEEVEEGHGLEAGSLTAEEKEVLRGWTMAGGSGKEKLGKGGKLCFLAEFWAILQETKKGCWKMPARLILSSLL